MTKLHTTEAMFAAGAIILVVGGLHSLRAESPTFERDVLPILNSHCLQCHGGVHQRNGLDLRTHAAVMSGGQSGPVVEPGSPERSLLWEKVGLDSMPKTDNKVSAANKEIIRRWIAEGAKAVERKSEEFVSRPAMKPAEFARLIDQRITSKLERERLSPGPRADDAEFLRRVSLDIAGQPPRGADAAAFLADTDARKREKLVDALLASGDFGRHFAERWVNLFYLTTVNQRPQEPAPYIEWLAKSLNEGRGWDVIVRDTLTAEGPLTEAPQGQFFYYNGDMNSQFSPKILAGNISQVFLGLQLQCAECHDHPFNAWKQTDFWSVAAFFANTMRMERVENNNTKGVLERHLEVRPGKKPEPPPKSIQISIPNDGEARNGGNKVPAAFLDGDDRELDPTKNHRQPFADWLTAKNNRYFAQAAVNRLWAHFFARGFVNPLNDFGDHNAPSHPELLDDLADEFIAAHFDVKHLVRCICLSDAYQRTSRVGSPADSARIEALFGRMTVKALTPEQLHDALCATLEETNLTDPALPVKKPNPKAPPPPSPRTTFIGAFRNPSEGDDPLELKLGVPHALKLMNQRNFNSGGGVVARLMRDDPSPDEVLEGLFLAALSRRPSDAERSQFRSFVEAQPAPREAYARVLWVLINSSEFQLNQ